jgi:SAM-dependent methyltransferase
MSDEYKDYYETIAPVFGQVRLDRAREIETTIAIIRRHVSPEEGYILDVGCGTGRYSVPLKEYGYTVVGIDKSISQLRYVPTSIPFVCASATALPFGNDIFAACLVVLVIHQVPTEDRTKLIEESWRVLKAKGKLIIKTCSFDDLRKRPFNSFFPSGLKINLKRYPDIPYIERQLKESGFSNVDVIPTYTEELFEKNELLSSIKHKHNTTLNLIPAEEFNKGYDEIEMFYADQDQIRLPHYHTMIIAEK